MNITRSQSFILAAAFLLLFFATGIFFAKKESRVMQAKPEQPSAQDTPQSGEPHFTLNDFERSETKNGRKTWQIKGKVAEYYPQTSTATVQEASLWFFHNNGDIIRLTAENATIALAGTDLRTADLTGDVLVNVENRSVRIETDRAIYNKESNAISAPGAVRITSEMLDLSGNSLVVDIDASTFVLEKDVHSVIRNVKVEK